MRLWSNGRLSSAAIAALALVMLLGSTALAGGAAPRANYVPNEYLIHVQQGTSVSAVEELVGRMGASLVSALPLADTYHIRVGRSGPRYKSQRVAAGAQAVKWTIDFIQPNYEYYRCAVPNDEHWDKLWGMRLINAPSAWEFEKGSAQVIVSVNDSGVSNHPDLIDRLVAGYDFVEDDSDPSNDVDGHGTHVSGTIAAQGNNGIGVVGVCWDGVKIMPIRVLDDEGSGTSAGIISGLNYALQNDVDVVNMSYGGYGDDPSQHLKLMELDSAGVILVAAAGNDATSMPMYPAYYDEVISVAAIGPFDAPSYFSNFGKIDIAAPGGDDSLGPDALIYSTTVTDAGTDKVAYGYGYMEGTSMACPHVAGAAALILSHGIPADEVRQRLQNSARPPSSNALDPEKYGAGILDLRAALLSARVRIVEPVKGSTVGSTPHFKINIADVEKTTIKVYLDYVDLNENGIPDDLLDTTDVVVDSRNVDLYLNATETALAFSWPLPTKSALTVGAHLIYVTANSKVDGSAVYDWAAFNVSKNIIPAGIHLFAFPYDFATVGAGGAISMSATPEDVLLDLNGNPLRFGTGGPGRALLQRWLPKTSSSRSVPYFSYPLDSQAWESPVDSMPDPANPGATLSWYTGGGYEVGAPGEFSFPAGSGFWLVLPTDAVINEDYIPLDPSNGYKVYLYSGWNMIGSPYSHAIPWQSALFTYRGQTKPLADAEAAGWVNSTLFGYSSSGGQGYERITARDMLQPFRGYWIRALVGGAGERDSLIVTLLP